MSKGNGNVIETVQPDSPAFNEGLKAGDVLIAINGNKINDSIDLAFYSEEPELALTLSRRERTIEKVIRKEEDEDLGITLRPFKIKTCKNRCLFCFVSQLPKGLRKSLYIKDEDYRLSFLYGSYLTLSNLSEGDRKRIVDQRLSPLYISVHSTDKEVRNTLLGNPNSVDILKEIAFFVKHKIRLHTQIVVCPGINDGPVLEKTITDLRKFYPYVASIAVVPVGLTGHGRRKVNPFTVEEAQKVLDCIGALQKKFEKKHGENVVYAADELYLKANAKLPALVQYGELSQLENGVGMVPLFLHKASRFRQLKHVPDRPVITFTGLSFYPFLQKFVTKVNKKHGTDIRVVPVENQLFGPTVTVAGLLSGRDVIRVLLDHVKGDEVLLMPDVVLESSGAMFLDDITPEFIAEVLKVKINIIESTCEGLIKGLEELA